MIKIHAVNGGYIVEGFKEVEEEVPVLALPAHLATGEPYAQHDHKVTILMPALRYSPALDKAIELVKWRATEGDLDPMNDLSGPTRPFARAVTGEDPVMATKWARLEQIEGGYMVKTYTMPEAPKASVVDVKAKDASVSEVVPAILSEMSKFMPSFGRGLLLHKTYAMATVDEACGVLREFFGAA